MADWQHIKTAPKKAVHPAADTGPFVWLRVPFDPPVALPGYWCCNKECWRYQGDDGAHDIQPTGWLPFAAAPEVGEAHA